MKRMNKNDEYYNLSIDDKMDFIDDKMEDILKSFGYGISKFQLKPKNPSKFIFFKKPNIIILKEDKISDDENYIKSIYYTLSILNKEFKIFKEDKLVFIYLMEFPIHHLITFFIHLSYYFPIEIYFSQEMIDKFNLKNLEDPVKSSDNFDNLNNLDENEKKIN